MTSDKRTKRRSPRSRAPAKAGDAKPRRGAETRYHHGALREALLQAAERVLERDGLQGLTLRAAAREAGVSHAAPAHHFGDAAGLLSELAAVGFARFNATLNAASAIEAPPPMRAMARAKAYIAYARRHPAMYLLMFRTERLDMNRPALAEASGVALASLAGVVGVRREAASTEDFTMDQAAEIARAWSLMHGYTMLLLDGRLQGILNHLPGADPDSLFEAMLRLSPPRPRPEPMPA